MIEKITIKNFKAIQSATIKLTDLSVFVGNNGSGKSSVIEALQTLQNVLLSNISDAFNNRWIGLEQVRNNVAKKGLNDIEIGIQCKINRKRFTYKVRFNTNANGDIYLATYERLAQGTTEIFEVKDIDEKGRANLSIEGKKIEKPWRADRLALSDNKQIMEIPAVQDIYNYIISWQFLALAPEQMYFPVKRDYSLSKISLDSSGENLAVFFSRLLDKPSQCDLIFEKMRYVLPDLEFINQRTIPVQKQVYLLLQEQNSKTPLPSWLFSSGTLRILAILAVLGSKTPPPIVFIEEIENGLDPRTLNLLVEEIRGLMPEHQFIATTHSPYFLDLVDLRHIIVAERTDGKTEYYRPDDDKRLDTWKKTFSAGKLYTMNQLKQL